MIWRRATFVLIAVLVGLCAWIYLRDKGPYAPQRSERSEAGRDAALILELMAPSHACAGRCTVELTGRTAPRVWRMRLSAPGWQRCFTLRVNAFAATEAHGVTGAQSIACHG